MNDKKSIGISALITLGIVALSMLTPGFFDNSQYYCEYESSIKECTELSGGLHTRCYLDDNKTSWDYCKTGWILIEDDRVQEEPENITLSNETLITIRYSNGKVYDCIFQSGFINNTIKSVSQCTLKGG